VQGSASLSLLCWTTFRTFYRSRASYLVVGHRLLVLLVAGAQHVRCSRLLLSGIWARVIPSGASTCPENIPLANTSRVRRNAAHFVFSTPLASKCIPNSSFSCLHSYNGSHGFGRGGRLPLGIRGLKHCGEVRIDAKELVSSLWCELRTQPRAIDASKVNSRIKSPLVVPTDAGSKQGACKSLQTRCHVAVPPNRWLTSGIQSVESAPNSRWHYRLFVAATAFSKAVRLLRLSRSSSRHFSNVARAADSW
jgi:hypothetical protein